jgi:hypothetical protein
VPITNIQFVDGIYFCRQVGEITPEDASLWADYADHYAQKSLFPIVALIDATHCTYIKAKARAIFARASLTPNVHIASVAVREMKARQSVELTAMMALRQYTVIFDTLKEAEAFAVEQVQMLRDGAGV